MERKGKTSAHVSSLPPGRVSAPAPRRDAKEAPLSFAAAAAAAEPSPQNPLRRSSAAENRRVSGASRVSALAECRPEAFALSQALFIEGLEELSVELGEIARSGIESAAARTREMLAVKTLTEAVEVQLAVARDGFEAFFAGSLKLSELGVELARKTSEPLFAELFARRSGASS